MLCVRTGPRRRRVTETRLGMGFVAVLVIVAGFASAATAATPRNGRIAFSRLFPEQIFTMAADGTDITRLTRTKMPSSDPAWSADGTQIAFVRAERGWTGSKLVLMLGDGSGKSVVTQS